MTTVPATPPVTIYSLTTCGWSRKAKAYFKERGVPFYAIEYDMAGPDLQRKISAEMRRARRRGVPVRQDRRAGRERLRPRDASSGCSRRLSRPRESA